MNYWSNYQPLINHRNMEHYNKIRLSIAHLAAYMVGFALIVLLPFAAHAQVTSAITAQLDIGDTGAQVTILQELLRTDPTIYPEALVTGYFGPLTEAAVQRFQCRELSLCSGSPTSNGYGRVGPQTLAKLNVHIAATGTLSGGTTGNNTGVPFITNIQVNTSSVGSATISWATSESTRGRVYYQTAFPTMIEASATTEASVQAPYIADATLGDGHTITLANLTSGQQYYYVIEAIDATGDVSYTWPATFTAK